MWHKCELHCHTMHSDGSMSVDMLADRALRRGYSAIALTDHNTLSATESFVATVAKAGITPVRGIEWTTFYGHITVLGTTDIDWREVSIGTFDECVRRAAEQGAAVNIAHPDRWGYPVGAGCHFDYAPDSWDNIAGMEVYWGLNPHASKHCARSLKRWRGLIGRGERIAALYSYDWHTPDDNATGYAATYLAIEGEIDEASCIAAVIAGRTLISLIGGADIAFITDGKEYIMGDEAPKGAVGKVKLKLIDCEAGAAEGYTLYVTDFVTGERVSSEIRCGVAEAEYVANNAFGISVAGGADGCLGEVLISSPIYVKGGKV